jgi:hypothetical protein
MLIYYVVLMVMLVCVSSLVVDFARVQGAKTELCTLSDAAARYAVTGLGDNTASTKAIWIAAQHKVDNLPYTLPASAVEIGKWDASTKVFTVTSTSPNAVRITAERTAAAGNAIQLPCASVVGQKTCDVKVSSIAYYNANVMLLVGNTALNTADTMTRDRLIGRGYNVIVRDSTFTLSEADEMLLVVVSETCTSTAINSRLLTLAVPVINYEPFIADDMGFTGPTQDVNYGLSSGSNRITIDQPAHPIAAGLSGTVTISTLPDTQPNAGFGWGIPGGTGVKVASIYGESTHGALYCWDVGSTLYNGTAAPARRVQLWGSGPNGTWLGGVPADTWNANGWQLFDAAVTWAIGTTPSIRLVKN